MNVLKKAVEAICLSLVLGGTQCAVAEQNYKLGVVDVVRVFKQTPQAEEAISALQKEFSPRDEALVATQEKLGKMEERLQRDRAIMSSQELEKLEREIITLKRELKRDQDEFRDDVNFRRNEELAKVREHIAIAIQKVATENEYDLVLTDGVIHVTPKVDISDLVITYLKKEYSTGKK